MGPNGGHIVSYTFIQFKMRKFETGVIKSHENHAYMRAVSVLEDIITLTAFKNVMLGDQMYCDLIR